MIFTYVFGLPALSYLLLMLYAAIASNFGVKLPDILTTEYIVILICVIIATILRTLYKNLTNREEQSIN